MSMGVVRVLPEKSVVGTQGEIPGDAAHTVALVRVPALIAGLPETRW